LRRWFSFYMRACSPRFNGVPPLWFLSIFFFVLKDDPLGLFNRVLLLVETETGILCPPYTPFLFPKSFACDRFPSFFPLSKPPLSLTRNSMAARPHLFVLMSPFFFWLHLWHKHFSMTCVLNHCLGDGANSSCSNFSCDFTGTLRHSVFF